MKLHLIITAALAALAAPAIAETTDYRVIVQEHDVGHYTVTRDGPKVSVDYDYKQNGRGPTIKEHVACIILKFVTKPMGQRHAKAHLRTPHDAPG